ncbi:hypothetical protein DM02DRAFT_546703 [Periconia macrospinosa]|uniref:Uncharacterized protein n=1 Tax=Periconia macrospinosa TaxID=97972 RepID=A0A2V1D164_9PLEO|nr:hypothetical protein DM02DRAFT_546703 [Periconia macrospinosa]
MPPDRRSTFPNIVKPIKTERTHEENQERAYIAASRRSDRSLEARIESARRASEIHKKRTGRGLRVTEQDVVNEEMYEEEDDDLPTQYQRLNAHLQTSSWIFNRKLHDYIATQHGVRSMFMHQQFPGQAIPQYGSPQFQPNGQVPMMNQPMLPFQNFRLQQPHPQPQPQQHHHQQQQGFRQAPYSIPARNNMHQRSASVSTPLAMPSSAAPLQPAKPNVTTPGADGNRRMSLPPNVLEQQSGQGPSRPILSRRLSRQATHQPSGSPDDSQQVASAPQSGQVTPQVKSEDASPAQYGFPSFPFDSNSQVIGMNPLSLSLPPESQQFVGSALDPQDPRTAILMAGSDHLPQPFGGTYTYNPNVSPKSARVLKATDQVPTPMQSSGMSQTLAPENDVTLNTSVNNSDSNTLPSAEMENLFDPSSSLISPMFTQQAQSTFDFSYFDNQLGMGGDVYEDSTFINWEP